MKTAKTRVLCFLLLLALALPLLSACGREALGEEHALFSEVYRSDPVVSVNAGYTKHELLTDVLPDNLEDGVGKNGLFRYRVTADDKYYVYNVNLGRVVLEIEKSTVSSADDISLLGRYIVVTESATSASATLIYSASGRLLASMAGKQSVSSHNKGFLMGDTFYVVEDEAVAKTFPSLPTVDASHIFAVLDDYVIVEGNSTISYYDERSSQIRYVVPENAAKFNCWMLADGRLLAQYVTLVDPASETYSFIDDGEKYELHQEIFDPARGKAKKLKLEDVYLRTVYNENRSPFDHAAFYDVFREEVDGVLEYRPIVDGVIASRSRYVLLSADGEFGKAIDAFVEGQTSLVEPAAGGRYYVHTETGGALLDGTGQLIKRTVRAEPRAYGFVIDMSLWEGKLYNLDCDLVREYDNVEWSVVNGRSFSTLFYSQKTESAKRRYYRYDANGDAPIPLPDGVRAEDIDFTFLYTDLYYRVSDYSCDYYYGIGGTYLFCTPMSYGTEGSATFHVKTSTAALVQYTDAQTGATVYARLSS